MMKRARYVAKFDNDIEPMRIASDIQNTVLSDFIRIKNWLIAEILTSYANNK